MAGINKNNTPSRIRLGSYNMENLGKAGKLPIDKKEEILGKSIEEMNADIVSLQEVTSEAALGAFVSHNLPEGMYPYRHFFKTNDGKEHHLAVLSKYPIVETESNKDRNFIYEKDDKLVDTKFSRDVAETLVNVGGYPFKVYNVHLKADPYFLNNPSPEDIQKSVNKRTSEVEELRSIVREDLKEMPSMLYVITGDMNTTPGAPELKPLKDCKDTIFIDPMDSIDGPQTVTQPVTGRRLDAIILSPQLASTTIPGSMKVNHTEGAEKASDHLGIQLDIDLDILSTFVPKTDFNNYHPQVHHSHNSPVDPSSISSDKLLGDFHKRLGEVVKNGVWTRPAGSKLYDIKSFNDKELKDLDEIFPVFAADPAKGNKISPGTIDEAVVAITAEKAGVIKGPLKRDITGYAEFVDGEGNNWDVKSPVSPPPGSSWVLDVPHQLEKIINDTAGEKDYVMLNLTKCNDEDGKKVMNLLNEKLPPAKKERVAILFNR